MLKRVKKCGTILTRMKKVPDNHVIAVCGGQNESAPIRDVNPNVPEDVANIVDRALVRDMGGRYQAAGRMGFDLERYMYSNRFGPTNISLHRYLRSLFPDVPNHVDPTVPDPYFERLVQTTT